MKKLLSLILSLILVFTVSFASIAAPNKVVLSSQKIFVNGEEIPMEAYNIDGYNYFKLRDIAYILGGTASKFSVSYNEQTKLITAVSGEDYLVVGGEMGIGVDNSRFCVTSTQKVEFNGVLSSVEKYNIGGNNYFKLRDLADELNFDVDYDASTRSVLITSADYKDEFAYIHVTYSPLALQDTYQAYGYYFEYAGINRAEITGAELDGKKISYQNLTTEELATVNASLGEDNQLHGAAYYYFNASELDYGAHTLTIHMFVYHENGLTGEDITITHGFETPLTLVGGII